MTIRELAEKVFSDRRLSIAILVGLCIIIYLNSLNGAFVSDDLPNIVKAPLIGNLGRNLASGNLPQFTFSLNYHLGRSSPFIYHFTNLLIHIGVVILAYFFLLEIVDQEIAFVASAIYTVHPLNSEVVSWISGRPYSMGAIFALASLLLYLYAYKKKKLFYYFYSASLVCFLFALLSNNKLIVLFLIFGLYELIFGKIAKNWLKLVPYGLITVAFIIYLFGPFQARIASENPAYTGGVVLMNPLHQIPIALSTYLELFVFPLKLSLYHEDLSVSLVNYWLRLAVAVVLLGSLIYFYLKEKLVFFGLAFFLIPLIPTLLPVRIAWVVAERYVYFGLIGLCLIVGWALVRAFKKYPQVLVVVLGALVVLLSARTIVRNRDWRTRETLWVATVKVSPTSSKAWNNMGDIYAGKGDFQSSLRAFQRAIELRPNYVDAHHNMGVTYLQMKDFDNAIVWFEKTVAIFPLAQSYNDMGVAYFYKGQPDKAEESFMKALEVNPNSALAYNSLGLLYFKLGRVEEARQAWLRAIELDPYSEGIRKNLQLLEQSLQASPSASPQ